MEEKTILRLNFEGEIVEQDFSYMMIMEFTKPGITFHRNGKSYCLDKMDVFFEDNDHTKITVLTFKTI